MKELARVAYLEKEQVPEDKRWLYDNMEKSRGSGSNIFKAAAHNARVMRGMMVLGTALLEKSKLDARLRELAILRVGQMTNCQYEQAHHILMGRRAGVTDAEIAALPNWSTSSLFDARDRAVLRFVEEVTKQADASDQTFDALREYFDQQELVELTMTVAYYNMIVRFLVTMRIDLEPGLPLPA